MKTNLALLHRYTLVRIHVKIGDHYQAAKLLIQVAANISLFPARSYTTFTLNFSFPIDFHCILYLFIHCEFADVVPILTSTVIECQRVGFQKAAFSYASMLMRSEYRSQIDSKYTKKIEAIVRKAPRGIKDAEDEYQDETQRCPLCDFDLPIMELSCFQCKTTLPICVATVFFKNSNCFFVHVK